MIKYTIHNITHEPHDLDPDVAVFNFEVHFSEPKPLRIPYFYTMHYFEQDLSSAQPAFYDFYRHTRRSLDTFGPAEIQTIEALGDEGQQQLYAHLEEYLLTCDWMADVYEFYATRAALPPVRHGSWVIGHGSCRTICHASPITHDPSPMTHDL